MPLTDQQKAEYVGNNGISCPYCRGNISVEQTRHSTDDPALASNDEELRVYVCCDDCGRRWVEVLRTELVTCGIEEIAATPSAPLDEERSEP